MSKPAPSAVSPDGSHTPRLKKALGPLTLWGLGVGYVISGEYFAWSLGLPEGGTYGLLATFALVTVMYVAFVFSYIELACAMPRAGGVFVYGVRGLGLTAGFVGGIAQAIEFVFALPSIALAIAAYLAEWWAVDRLAMAVGVYFLFTGLNLWGVRQTAIFELCVTILAVGELLLFTGVTAPHFSWERFTANAWPGGWTGMLATVPYAIWFYLAIEGVANAAEEARDPRRDVPIGFGAAILTLVVLAVCVVVCSIGVGGWERIVYDPQHLSAGPDGAVVVATGARPNISPLPLALGQIVERGHALYHLLVGIGLLGLVASFNGIVYAAGRGIFEMGREGSLPHVLGTLSRRTATPTAALAANLVIGVLAIYRADADKLVTMSALGAVTLYIVAMLSLLRLRRREPELARPYRTPFYPALPLTALVLATGCLVVMLWYNFDGADLWNSVSVWYATVMAASLAYFRIVVRPRLSQADLERVYRIE